MGLHGYVMVTHSYLHGYVVGIPTNINREKFERSRLLTIERRLRTPFSSSGVPPPFHPAFPIQLCRRQKSVKSDRRDNKKKKNLY